MEMTSYNDVDAGDMFAAADYYSAGAGGDLFDMVWPGRRRREEDNTSGCLPLSPPPPPELAVDDQLLAGGDGGGGKPVAVAVAEDDDSGERWTEDQVPTDEGICVMGTRSESSKERRKITRARRSSRYSQTHSLTERKRRCKINENLKTLQQLVPVCDKSNNQASTLDKTIRYMKSLQQHAQAMSVGCSMKTAEAAGVTCPFLPPPPYVRPAIAGGGGAPAGMVPRPLPPSMVPFAPVLSMAVHHTAPLMMMPAAPAPLMMYPAAAAGSKGVAGESLVRLLGTGKEGAFRRCVSTRRRCLATTFLVALYGENLVQVCLDGRHQRFWHQDLLRGVI
ncbi:Os12g0598200 [Oryza sativa Japonica Group]|uniref:Os12g0598200 protein n=1 Tax=Oryza sativa subsp. japonica TaxID=39947 RepID=A0A0P0YC64_ORYSJ|nr:Os12g0598200 [Oryza sativa Japonica Group]